MSKQAPAPTETCLSSNKAILSQGNHVFCSGFGQFHTDEQGKDYRQPYATISFEQIKSMVDNPPCIDKESAQWLIPSALRSRNFKTQEKSGKYGLLWLDFDDNPPSLPEIKKHLTDTIGDVDFEAYNTRSATADNQKCRALIPLSQWLTGKEWQLCQQILNDKFSALDIIPDCSNERAAQLCYLPNRGKFYSSISNRDDVFFDAVKHFKDEILAIGVAREQENKRIDAMRKAAQEKRATLQYDGSEGGLINAFNQSYTTEDILLRAGYKQRGLKFCHPLSKSGNYAASIDPSTGRVHTLSTKDQLYSDGGAHDAFSCFEILEHSGDRSAALKDAGNNYLAIDGVSWNKFKQREFKKKQNKTQEGLKGLKGLKASNNTGCKGAKKKAKGANLAPKLGELAYIAPEYPIEALGSLANVAGEISEKGQVDISMAAQSLLSAISLCAQGAYEIETLTGKTPLSLYCLTIAGSGEGKSSAEKIALKEVRDYQKAKHEIYLNELEAEKGKPKKDKAELVRNPYMICNDATTQGIVSSFKTGHPSQALFTAEGATMFSGWGMSAEQKAKTAGDLNRFWDGETISVVRSGSERTQLYNRRFCTHILIQPSAVREAISDDSLSAIGLFPRFLIAWAPPLAPRKFKEFPYWSNNEVKNYWNKCHELLIKSAVAEDGGCPDFTKITLSPMAKSKLIQFFEKMELARKKDNDLHELKPFATRAPEQACRIAGCLAAYDGKEEVDELLMTNAIKLAIHSLKGWKDATEGREESEHDQWASQLYKWLLTRAGMQTTEADMIQRAVPKSLRNAKKRDIALNILRDRDLIEPAVSMVGDSIKVMHKTWVINQ